MSTETSDSTEVRERTVSRERVEDVVIRFAGDSGDGMQLTGGQLTSTSAMLGNDLATLPDFPAEIRAPAGTLPGVSAFQVRIANYDIHTPGDAPDVLVAMNPAALKKSIEDLKANGILIVNTDEFNTRNLKKAGYDDNPLDGSSLDGYRVYPVGLSTMTRRVLEDSPLDFKSRDRCRNFFALGMIYWLYSRPLDNTIQWLETKFAKKPDVAEANVKVMKAGYNYCDITRASFRSASRSRPAAPARRNLPEHHGQLSRNSVSACVAGRRRRPACSSSSAATPSLRRVTSCTSSRRYKNYGVVTTFQAEDEIAAICASIGAAYRRQRSP